MLAYLEKYTFFRDVVERSQDPDINKYVELFLGHMQSALDSKGGDWNISIYDTAWVLCTDFFQAEERDYHLTLLLAEQNEDGTWGDASYMPHSPLVDTLAMAMALYRLNRPIPKFNQLEQRVDQLLLQSKEYINHDTVAFEIIVPLLINWLEDHGVEFQLSDPARQYLNELARDGRRKLEIMAKGPGWFNPQASLSYTAEFLALVPLTDDDVRQIPGLMLENGAVGLSPAATAAVIVALREHGQEVPEGLYEYLRYMFDTYDLTGFPDLFPYAHTQRLWNLVPWILSGNLCELLQRDERVVNLVADMYRYLRQDQEGRVSWDEFNTELPDLDDTSVTFALYALLTCAGVKLEEKSSTCFSHFQRPDGSFFCYPHEAHPSPVGSLHALMALEIASDLLGPDFANDEHNQGYIRDLLLDIAPDGKTIDQMCHDKWHASWTYGAQRWLSIRIVRETYPKATDRLIDAILEREQDSGGWGQQDATLEETAYIIAGLAAVLPYLEQSRYEQVVDALGRAKWFMHVELMKDQVNIPLIWISKNVYVPLHQVVSAIFDAELTLFKLSEENVL